MKKKKNDVSTTDGFDNELEYEFEEDLTEEDIDCGEWEVPVNEADRYDGSDTIGSSFDGPVGSTFDNSFDGSTESPFDNSSDGSSGSAPKARDITKGGMPGPEDFKRSIEKEKRRYNTLLVLRILWGAAVFVTVIIFAVNAIITNANSRKPDNDIPINIKPPQIQPNASEVPGTSATPGTGPFETDPGIFTRAPLNTPDAEQSDAPATLPPDTGTPNASTTPAASPSQTAAATETPVSRPTNTPSAVPTGTPNVEPTHTPAATETPDATASSSSEPTPGGEPTDEPTAEPTSEPTPEPTPEQTQSEEPTAEVTPEPTDEAPVPPETEPAE